MLFLELTKSTTLSTEKYVIFEVDKILDGKLVEMKTVNFSRITNQNKYL